MKRRHLRLVSLALVMATFFGVIVSDSVRLVDRSFPGFLIWDNGMLLAFHGTDWTGVSAGMPTYARLVAVNGEHFVDRASLMQRVAALPLGTPVEYEIFESGVTRVIPVATMSFPVEGHLSTFGVYIFGAAICWLTMLAVLYLKGGSSDARGLAVMLFMVGLSLLLAVDLIGTSRFGRSLAVAEPMTAIAILHFVGFFPRPRMRKNSLRLFLTGAYALAAAYGMIGASYFYAAPEFSRKFNDFAYLGIALALAAAVFALGYSVIREASSVDRVRAAIVFAGAFAACVVPTIAVPAFFLLGWAVSWSWIFAPVFLFPVAVLYAVARHNLFEAEKFIRLSLGYTVASSCATLLFSVLVFVLDTTLFPDLKDGPGLALLFVLVLVVTFNPLLERTQRTIDRYFYRSAADPGRVLEELGADLAECSEEDGIRSKVEESLVRALELDWARLEVVETGRAMERADLEIPVYFRSERIGQICCGPKKSGAPFARADRDLVGGMAAQAAIALRNAQSLEALREAQESLVRKERLATMGELAGSVAHGVRNPLAGIRASAQIARQEATTDEIRETMTGIISESDRLENRVRALLDFSKPFQPSKANVDLAEIFDVLRSAIEPRARRSGIELEMSPEAPKIHLTSDANFLEEALLELAGNALRTMDEKGGRLKFAASESGGRVLIRIEDTGPGIPEEVRSRVFDLFFSTRPDGTGVGLATVKRIIEALDGTISVAPAEPPPGTAFEIEFPSGAASLS